MNLKLVLAAIPIIWLVVALGILKLRAYKAALIGLGLALLIAPLAFHFPVRSMAVAALSGLRFALVPICFIILAALFTYRLCKRSGALLVIRSVLGGVSPDARVMTLLVAWGFGNFMEGIAGFGTSVAIPAAVMAGIGIPPLRAVVACLISNSVSTAFGSVGVSAMALAKASGMDLLSLSFGGFLNISIGFIAVPLLIVIAVSGVRALKGVWWLCLAASVSFIVPCFLISRFVGPELPDAVGSIFSMITIIALAKRVKLISAYKLPAPKRAEREFSAYHIFRAACPFIFVVASLVGYAFLVPAAKNLLTPGVVILVASSLGGAFQSMDLRDQFETLKAAFSKNAFTYLTICAVLMMARVMDDSGMISVIAKALVDGTGRAYIACAPFVGALGGFVTGSGTSSNLIFGALQYQAASSLEVSHSLVTAANMFGGGIGKMIAPQSIAIGLAAVGLVGEEAKILKLVLVYFVLLLVIAAGTTVAFTLTITT